MGTKIGEIVDELGRVSFPENFSGHVVAIDAFNHIYQYLSSIHLPDGDLLRDRKGNITSHLKGLFDRNMFFMEKNIKPIYVFDGNANILKNDEKKRRANIKEEMLKKKEDAEDDQNTENIKKYSKFDFKLTSIMIDESKELLKYMGIPVIQAKQDGEAQASYMINKNDAWAISSQDYDCFLFGANRIIRNLSATHSRVVNGKKVNVDIKTYILNDVLSRLGIGKEHLIDIGILVGVDFYKGIKNIGINIAYKMIKKYGDIEHIIKNQQDEIDLKNIVFNFKDDEIENIRKIFLNPEVNINYDKPTWKKINSDNIIELLCEEHDFSKDTALSKLKRIEFLQSNKKQITLDKFHD
jgi:flap endonuclease-1